MSEGGKKLLIMKMNKADCVYEETAAWRIKMVRVRF